MSVRPIILAEDNEKLRRLYTDVLEAAGYKVLAACDGEKAVALLDKTLHPQLIILDVLMPRLDGIGTCRKMREQLALRKMRGIDPCPILFLTALDDPETLLECLRAGGDDYLVKSAPLEELMERIAHWCRRGCSGDAQQRRRMAIKELQAIAAQDGPLDSKTDVEDLSAEEAAVERLARFIERHGGDFDGKDQAIYRFGYVVGLVTTCIKQDLGSDGRSARFLKNVVCKTGFLDRQEIEVLLDNYERIANQSQFRKGWTRGRDDAPKVGIFDPSISASGAAPV